MSDHSQGLKQKKILSLNFFGCVGGGELLCVCVCKWPCVCELSVHVEIRRGAFDESLPFSGGGRKGKRDPLLACGGVVAGGSKWPLHPWTDEVIAHSQAIPQSSPQLEDDGGCSQSLWLL